MSLFSTIYSLFLTSKTPFYSYPILISVPLEQKNFRAMKPIYTLLFCFFFFVFRTNAYNFTVGEKNGWTFGFDYTYWVGSIPGGLCDKDNLVFKYPRGYDVYLLDTDIKFENCDFEGAKLIAGQHEGGGDGFSFKLEACRKYYFACGVGDGKYCKQGLMRFPVYAQGNCS